MTDPGVASIVEKARLRITVTRYGSRYWAIYLKDELVAVTVYKKGALAVQAIITRLEESREGQR